MLVRAPGRPFSLDPLIAEAHRRARRRRWLLACVLVVATAAIAAFELRSTSASGLAAAGRPVVHIVTEDSPSTVYFDLKTGRKTVKTFGEESWLDQQTGWHHGIMTEGGRRVTEQLWKAHYGPNTQAAAVDRFFIGLATDDYREALKNGMVKRVGRGTFEGHHVDWLRVVPRRDDRWYGLRGEEVGIDSQTFKPLLIRFASGKHYSYTRILLAQAIAYNPADFKRRGGPRQLPPYRGQLAPGYAFGSTDSSAAQTTVVHGPWLTAGTTVAGLELRAVTPFTIRRSKHHFSYGAPTPKLIHGLELVYGPASQQAQPTLPALINLYGPQWEPGAATRDTTVYEVPRAPRVPPWSTVPADSIQVQTGLTTLGSRVVPSLSIGYLKERGLYVTIRTPQGQQTALRIARSLRAAGK